MTIIRNEPFIEAWQKSKSIGEVTKRLGASYTYCVRKACDLRKRYKIPLKFFHRGRPSIPKSEIAKLRRLAKASYRK